MLNHFHLAVETPAANLGAGMQWLQVTWARRWLELGRISGRPFQDRYQAIHVEPGRPLADVINYIHLNPVRSGVSTVQRLGEYPWSSLAAFGAPTRPSWLVPDVILRENGPWPDSRAGWTRYLRHLEKLATSDASRRHLSSARLSRSRWIGSKAFIEKIKMRMHNSAKPSSQNIFEKEWSEQLARFAKAAGVNLRRLPAAKTAPPKALLAAAMKAATSASNAWLAKTLSAGQPATISQMARRVRLNPILAVKLEALVQKTGF
jgi:hypothetical protein